MVNLNTVIWRLFELSTLRPNLPFCSLETAVPSISYIIVVQFVGRMNNEERKKEMNKWVKAWRQGEVSLFSVYCVPSVMQSNNRMMDRANMSLPSPGLQFKEEAAFTKYLWQRWDRMTPPVCPLFVNQEAMWECSQEVFVLSEPQEKNTALCRKKQPWGILFPKEKNL